MKVSELAAEVLRLEAEWAPPRGAAWSREFREFYEKQFSKFAEPPPPTTIDLIREEFDRIRAEQARASFGLPWSSSPGVRVVELLLERLTLGPPLSRIVKKISVNDGFLVVQIASLDRQSGALAPFCLTKSIPAGMADLFDAMKFLRRALLDAAAHEVDESLHLDGRRFADPHALPGQDDPPAIEQRFYGHGVPPRIP